MLQRKNSYGAHSLLFGMFSFLSFNCLFSLIPTYAEVQFAQVRSSAAIVYADIDLLAPIGYFPAGSTIKVGKVFRKYGHVLPTAVGGHIAFVRVEDLVLPLEMAALAKQVTPIKTSGMRESIEVIETEEKIEDRLRENNYLLASFGPTSASDFSPAITSYFQQNSRKDGVGVQLFFKHRAPFRRAHWGVGVGYYRFAEQQTLFHYPTLECQISYRMLQLYQFSLELFAGVQGSFDARISDEAMRYQYLSTLYGSTYGGQLFYRPYQKLGGSFLISSQRNYFANVRARQSSPAKFDSLFKRMQSFNHYLFLFSVHLRL